MQNYRATYDTTRTDSSFSALEKKILDLVIPADISIRYLFGDQESKLITEHILSSIYPPQDYQALLESFVQDGERTQELIDSITDFDRMRANFFYGLQNYIKAKITRFADQNS